MKSTLFVIGHVSGLPPGAAASIRARQVQRLEQADAVVAVCASDAWSEEEWSLLRQAHQEHRLPIFGTDGNGKRPPRPWPRAQWVWKSKGWFRLQTDPHGFDPGDTEILFENSVHRGKCLRECPLSYLDWLNGQEWLEPASFLSHMLRLYLGRKPRCEVAELEALSFDSIGFDPSEARAKVGVLMLRRPPAQILNEDLASDWDRRAGEERRDRNRVLRGHRTRRVNRWDRLLIALDHIERAEDAEDLEHKRDEALAWLKSVREGKEVSTRLREEVEAACQQREKALARKGPDLQALRVLDAVGRMRGCRSMCELEEEAWLIRLRKELYTEESLTKLRQWFTHFRSELTSRTNQVVNVRGMPPNQPGITYCGRPCAGWIGSPLANPFHIGRDGTRQEVIEKYRAWLQFRIAEGDREVLATLSAIGPTSVLACWCAPLRCHCEVIWEAWASR
jgi:hypothetical protein